MKPLLYILTVCCILACTVMAQKPSPSPSVTLTPNPTPTPERPREIVALLNDARLAAPELAVDTFLKVIESKKVTDPAWRKEIIDEALRMIDDVQYPRAMTLSFGGQNELNDTAPYILASAFQSKFDQLSLKGRVITLLLETEPTRAKQMIFQIGGDFGLKPRSCEDVTSYYVDEIYPVVEKVATAVFTEKQVAEGQRALFVAPWIENIDSPTQIYPVVGLVQKMQGSQAERQILFSALAKAINRDFKDDRSFTYSQARSNLAVKIGKLSAMDADPLKADVVSAYRSMLIKNLRGTRCTDNEIKKDQPLPDYIEAANKLMPEKPLTYEDAAASELKGTAKVTHVLKKSTAFLKFRDELIAVRDIHVVDTKLVNDDVTDVAWASKVNEFIDRMLAYEGSEGETESEMLLFKGALIPAMISGVGPGELRNSLIRKHLQRMSSSSLQKTSFIEWLLWIKETERTSPESFYEIASEFPNPNLKVMASAKKLLEEPKKDPPKPEPAQTPKP